MTRSTWRRPSAAALALCLAAAAAQAAETIPRTFDQGGLARTYLLRLPDAEGPDSPSAVPLVLVLHGAACDGRITEVLTGMSPLADAKGFAVVYPDAENRLWKFWEPADKSAERAGRRGDDGGFLLAIVDQLIADGRVDRRRVYVTGISNGAYMATRLACDLADRIAAIAPVAGTMPKLLADAASPARPMPVLYIHGDADRIVGSDGRDFLSRAKLSLSAGEFVAWWAKANGCGADCTTEDLPDAADDGTTVRLHRHAAGDGGAPVVYYAVAGGGHTWPGGSPQPEFLLGKTCRDFVASAVIWEFFAGQGLPTEAPAAP
jgi:polyhydroxybutyrate depolymerase